MTVENYKNLSQVSRSPGQDTYPGHPKYEAAVLTPGPRRSVYDHDRNM
jgi:hypothetical protein